MDTVLKNIVFRKMPLKFNISIMIIHIIKIILMVNLPRTQKGLSFCSNMSCFSDSSALLSI